MPDALGLLECGCGWGGPEDPLESGHGFGRMIRRFDRRIATSQARRDLQRLRSSGTRIEHIGIGYAIILFIISTFIYLLLYAALAVMLYFGVRIAIEQAWIGLGLCMVVAAAIIYMLFPGRTRRKEIEAPKTTYPRLTAALDEVSQRVGAPPPQRVILTPRSEAFVYSHRPFRRFFRRELVLGLGVGALPLMSETDLKAVLAHELAHYRHGDAVLHRYYTGAENALARFVYLVSSGATTSRRWNTNRNPYGRSFELALDLLTLPVRLVWVPFHFLRLNESRMAEFAADRIAAETYGALSFVNGLTGLRMADNTLRGAGRSLIVEMRKHGGQNLYAELRSHYAALPAAIIGQLRVKAAQDFRSLERTHPSVSDRLRAVYGLGAPPPSEPYRPAFELLIPEGASSADAVETELTQLLLKEK